MSNAVIPVDIIRHTLSNGLGRYVCQLQRLTFRFCKEYSGSSGIRDYVEKNLVEFAKANPGVVVYLLPQRHTKAYIVAEYLNGHKEELDVNRMSAQDIGKWVELYRTRSGQPIVRNRKPWLTNYPSIQGTWTPQVDTPESLNVSNYPASEYSKAHKVEVSAVDIARRLAQKNE